MDKKNTQTLPRRLGWLGAFALAIGGANLSILVIGSLITSQGTVTIPLFAIGILISIIASFGWLELVLMYPNRVGGIASACIDAFAPYNPILANLAGTCYWFAWLCLISYGGQYAATTIHDLFLPHISVNELAAFLIVVAALINLWGLHVVQRVVIPFALLAIGLVLFFSFFPLISGQMNWTQATNFYLVAPFPNFFGEITSLMAGLYLIGWVAPGFENALCYVGETENPKRNVKIALFVSIVVAVIFFVVAPFIWLGALGPDNLTKDLTLVLAQMVSPAFAASAKILAGCFMLFNAILWIFAPLAGPPRTIATLAERGLLPAFVGKISARGVPATATFITAAIAIIIVYSGTPTWLIAATNFQYLLAISFASIAVWVLRKDVPNAPRLYKAPNILINLGLASALVWMISTVLGFQQYGFSTMVAGVVFSFSGMVFYLIRKMTDRRAQGLTLFPNSLVIKLPSALIFVLVIDTIGYLIAIRSIPNQNLQLITILEDIFVLVALLTLSVGLVLPGAIAHAAREVNLAARRLIHGTLDDFTKAMQALGEGRLESAHASADITPLKVGAKDEIGEMAHSFNEMQEKIKVCAVGLDNAREGLSSARQKLIKSNTALSELNQTLEQKVEERTRDVEIKNELLTEEIEQRKKLEADAEEMHNQLIVSARRAGMADIATSILHNIGNAVNTTNTSIFMLNEKIQKSGLENLEKLYQLLEANKDNLGQFFATEQGKQVIPFLNKLIESWDKEKQSMLEEVKSLTTNLSHVKEIIEKQNLLGTRLLVVEVVSMPSLIEDAISLCKVSSVKVPVEIIRDFKPLKKIVVDRVMLLQIIVNLIVNGLESVSESKRADKKIVISVFEKNAEYYAIEVKDNGRGISKENLEKIFLYGFTTKQKGHGFGLHNSALAAKDMGGKLEVASFGEHQGATFTLILPYEVKSKAGEKNKQVDMSS